MDFNAVGRWISGQFKYTPWTAWIITLNLAVWLLAFFQVPAPAEILAGELGVQAAWRWLTYPLVTPLPIIWLLVSLYVFHWIGSSLERRWGSEKFGRVFVIVTLVTASAYWVGHAVIAQNLNPSVSLSGLMLPELTLFVMWAALNAEATVLAFFVIPVKASYLAIAAIVITYFARGEPVLGLFVITVPIGGWFWAKSPNSAIALPRRKGKSLSERLQERKRAKKKSKFKLLEGQSKAGPPTGTPSLRELNRRKEEETKLSADEAELDRILDKIRFEGMAALTPEERETLDSQSRKLKGEG